MRGAARNPKRSRRATIPRSEGAIQACDVIAIADSVVEEYTQSYVTRYRSRINQRQETQEVSDTGVESAAMHGCEGTRDPADIIPDRVLEQAVDEMDFIPATMDRSAKMHTDGLACIFR